MTTRVTLYAEDGFMLTNDNVYCKVVHLAVGEKADVWKEITEAEYNAIVAETEAI